MARPVLPLNGSCHKVSTETAGTKEARRGSDVRNLGAKEIASDMLSNNSLQVRIYFDSNTKKRLELDFSRWHTIANTSQAEIKGTCSLKDLMINLH